MDALQYMKNNYTIQIFWSEEDGGGLSRFVATGLSAFGESREEALVEAEIALDLMIEAYVANGVSLPLPVSELIAA